MKSLPPVQVRCALPNAADCTAPSSEKRHHHWTITTTTTSITTTFTITTTTTAEPFGFRFAPASLGLSSLAARAGAAVFSNGTSSTPSAARPSSAGAGAGAGKGSHCALAAMSDCRWNRGHGWACGERVRLRRVFAKGTIDEPAGDCLHCHTVFYAAGFKDEFGSKEKFNVERDNDIALAGPFTKACALWLAARNERRRCRARSDGKRARSGNNLLSELQESRLGRKRILKTRQRNLKVTVPRKTYTPERYLEVFKKTIA